MNRLVRRHGRLRPRRIGCLLAVLIIAALWALTQTLQEISSLFGHHPAPVAGSPFDTITRLRPHSGSPTIDRILLRGKLIVAIQEIPGLAQRSPTTEDYIGFDIALADLIAHHLGVDPARTSFKPLTPRIREPALLRGETDLLLDYEITPEHSTHLDIAGPYLVQQDTEYGIGLPPHDPVIHQRITAVLRQAINDGTWAHLYTQYLPTPVPTPPTPR
jgi:ABC-type amino acid transport substrate-binding protein